MYRPDTYDHVWEGGYYTVTDAQVFRNKFVVEGFQINRDHWEGPYQGGDFGFANDPTAAIRCWIDPVENVLYISNEAYGYHIETDDLPNYISSHIGDFDRYPTRWDSSRPETISYLRRKGFPRSGPCSKWTGIKKDGVTFLRSFRRIVIHSECPNTAREIRLYSYKRDKDTEEILPVLIDKDDHTIDALIYALQPKIKRRAGVGVL
jgi:phage terminase large subunit